MKTCQSLLFGATCLLRYGWLHGQFISCLYSLCVVSSIQKAGIADYQISISNYRFRFIFLLFFYLSLLFNYLLLDIFLYYLLHIRWINKVSNWSKILTQTFVACDLPNFYMCILFSLFHEILYKVLINIPKLNILMAFWLYVFILKYICLLLSGRY